MSNRRTLIILALSGLMLFPFVSHAEIAGDSGHHVPGDICVNKEPVKPTEREIIKFAQNTLSPERLPQSPARVQQNITAPKIEKEAPLMAVKNKDNKTYFNRFIEIKDLTAVTTRINIRDTYSYTHNGRVFTNKVVN